jgi:hypothetical protein
MNRTQHALQLGQLFVAQPSWRGRVAEQLLAKLGDVSWNTREAAVSAIAHILSLSEARCGALCPDP